MFWYARARKPGHQRAQAPEVLALKRLIGKKICLCSRGPAAYHDSVKSSVSGNSNPVMLQGQLEGLRWRRWIALGCVSLVLLFAGLAATHFHSDAQIACGSRPCAICISLHSNAPAVTAHSLHVLFAIDSVAIPFVVEGKGFAVERAFFIRPPPAV
jgi:hypothetical protein